MKPIAPNVREAVTAIPEAEAEPTAAEVSAEAIFEVRPEVAEVDIAAMAALEVDLADRAVMALEVDLADRAVMALEVDPADHAVMVPELDPVGHAVMVPELDPVGHAVMVPELDPVGHAAMTGDQDATIVGEAGFVEGMIVDRARPCRRASWPRFGRPRRRFMHW